MQSKTKRTLASILEEAPEKKIHVKRYLKETLTSVLNKADFSALLNHSILHTPFLNYFEYASFSGYCTYQRDANFHLLEWLTRKSAAK